MYAIRSYYVTRFEPGRRNREPGRVVPILQTAGHLTQSHSSAIVFRPICEPDAVADSIRWPVVEPDREVRGFQSVLIDLGARLRLPGFTNDDGSARYRDYADYMVNHQRRPGVGPLAGFRGNGTDTGRGRITSYNVCYTKLLRPCAPATTP